MDWDSNLTLAKLRQFLDLVIEKHGPDASCFISHGEDGDTDLVVLPEQEWHRGERHYPDYYNLGNLSLNLEQDWDGKPVLRRE